MKNTSVISTDKLFQFFEIKYLRESFKRTLGF